MPSSNPVFLHSTWCGGVGMSWIGALLISSCITVTFIKRWNVIAYWFYFSFSLFILFVFLATLLSEKYMKVVTITCTYY